MLALLARDGTKPRICHRSLRQSRSTLRPSNELVICFLAWLAVCSIRALVPMKLFVNGSSRLALGASENQ